MHDPKLSAAVAQHQLLLSESLVDKLPSGQHFRQNSHLDQLHHRHSKMLSLPRTTFSTASYPDDITDSRSRFFPLFHRLKEAGTDMLHYPGYESAFSEVISQYRYSDIVRARRLFESLHGDQGSFALPMNVSAISRRQTGNNDYLFPCSTRRSSIVIKDLSPVSSSLPPSLPSLATTTSARLADTLSLSPLHVSTNVPSSPLSSESSPSPLRRSSVSPESRWADTHHRQQVISRPSLISSLSLPGDLTLYEDRGLQGERLFPPSAIPTSFTFPPPLWHPSMSMPIYGSVPPPLLNVCTPQSSPFESHGDIGQLLDHYMSSSASSSLAHHHLHHHLHRHHFVRDSFYNGNAAGSSLDSRSSPGKELPTKLLKQDRVRDRQELSSALEADREHTERLCNVKKSASTQTQFSSFSCENLPPPPYYTTHDTISRDKMHTSSAPGHTYSSSLIPPGSLPSSFLQYSHTMSSYHSPLNTTSSHPPPAPLPLPPPPPHSSHSASLFSHTPQAASNRLSVQQHMSPSPPTTPTLPLPSLTRQCSPPVPQSLPPYPSASKSCSPPPPPQYPSHGRVHADVQHAPLNLSLSGTPPIATMITHTRPSTTASGSSSPVIGDFDSYRDITGLEESPNPRLVSNKNGSNHETAAQVSDEAIEEHFRRSLGKCYKQPTSPKKVAVHVSEKICSVDDHFARALGDQMWTEIKARSEPAPVESLPGSVDAHFAKALGAAMWKKLKAENKLVDDVSSANQQQSQSQQTEEQTNRQKSPPSSPLQKSLVT